MQSDKSPHVTTHTQIVTTIVIPTSAPDSTTFKLGTMPLHPGSKTGVISIGSNVVSAGHQTTIGSDVVSFESGTLVASMKSKTIVSNERSRNSAAQMTVSDPFVAFLANGINYTAYSKGYLVGPKTTMTLPRKAVIDIGNSVLTFESAGVVLGSSTYAFHYSSRTNSNATVNTIIPTISGSSGVVSDTGRLSSPTLSNAPSSSSTTSKGTRMLLNESLLEKLLAVLVVGLAWTIP